MVATRGGRAAAAKYSQFLTIPRDAEPEICVILRQEHERIDENGHLNAPVNWEPAVVSGICPT
jgi:hypothetical protein